MWYWFIMTVHLWSLLLLAKEMHRKAQKHNGMQLHICDVAVTRFWDCDNMPSTRHGTAAAQIWLDVVYTCWWEGDKPCWFCTSLPLLKRVGPARCWLTLVLFTLPLLIVSRHTGTVLAVSSGSYCKRCMWQLNIICFIVHVNLYLLVTCSYHLYM